MGAVTQIFGRWLRPFGLEQANERLVREQFRLLARQIPVMYGIVIINCAFMAFIASAEVPPIIAYAFPSATVPVMVARVIYWRRRMRQSVRSSDVESMRRAMRSTAITANIMALILAAWAMTIMTFLPPRDAGFVPLFTILSMITCAYCLSSYPIAAYSVIASGSALIAIAMALTGDRVQIAMAGNIVLVSLLVIYMVAQQHGQLRSMVLASNKLQAQRGQAKTLAFKDQLTGLPNRRALIDMMRSHRRTAAASGAGMVMIDMNGFKPVNDTFGHRAGDLLLVSISERLRSVVQRNGCVARLGGDEFCIFAPGLTDIEELHCLAEDIRSAIKDPLLLDGHLLHLGAAMGITVCAQMPDNPHTLLQQADLALYESKSIGGSAISRFESQMEVRVRRRTLIEQALADRQMMEGIELLYQPIFELRTNRKVGYEALARWQHPVLGTIPPSEFIEVAERNGKARRVTLHLFRQAVQAAARWHPDLYLSFNLSGSGLCTAGFDRSLPAILAEHGFPPERLVLEVTETALLGDSAAAWRVLESLQQRGIRIVLDDFGAGHASIGYLRELRLDGIKLDGSMIRDITTDARSRKLLLGVLQLCRTIDVSVTAEMVETADQLAALQAFPIDLVQGYHLGLPGPVDAADSNGLLPAAIAPVRQRRRKAG